MEIRIVNPLPEMNKVLAPAVDYMKKQSDMPEEVWELYAKVRSGLEEDGLTDRICRGVQTKDMSCCGGSGGESLIHGPDVTSQMLTLSAQD